MKDPALLKEADGMSFEIALQSGERIAELVAGDCGDAARHHQPRRAHVAPGLDAIGAVQSRPRRGIIPQNHKDAWEAKPMSMEAVQTKTREFEVEDVEYLRHGDKPLFIRLLPAARRRSVPGDDRTARRRVDRERPHPQQDPSRGVRLERHRGRVARLPAGARRLSELGGRHQLRDPLGEGARRACSTAGRTSSAFPARRAAGTWRCWPRCGRTIRAMPRSRCRPVRPTVDASVRCVCMFWPVINPLGRHHNAKRLGESAEPAAVAAAHHEAQHGLLGERGEHVGGQPAAGDLARRKGGDAAGALDPGQERPDPRLPRSELRLRRLGGAALRRALPQGRRQDRSRILRRAAALHERPSRTAAVDRGDAARGRLHAREHSHLHDSTATRDQRPGHRQPDPGASRRVRRIRTRQRAPSRAIPTASCSRATVPPRSSSRATSSRSRSTARRRARTTGRSAPSASCMPRSTRRGRRSIRCCARARRTCCRSASRRRRCAPCSAPSATWARRFRSGISPTNSATAPIWRCRTWRAPAISRSVSAAIASSCAAASASSPPAARSTMR